MNNTHINYQEYLESYAWKALKKTKLEEQPNCECCWTLATSVHHLSYERLWREKPEDIVSICERCHEECHHVGGYQIKNDDETLRRRFEEVRDIYGYNKPKEVIKKNDIEYADRGTLIELNSKFSKDKNYVYYIGKIIIWADVKTFKILDWNYSSDIKYIYFYWEKIEHLDAKSFQIISKNYIKDKNGVYYYSWSFQYGIVEWKIEWADIETFEAIDDKHWKDKYSVYNGSRVLNIAKYNKQAEEDIFLWYPDPVFFTKDNIVWWWYINCILKKW